MPPALRELLAREDVALAGVNVAGDAAKLAADWRAPCGGCLELSDAANGRELWRLPGVARNIETRARWSLAGEGFLLLSDRPGDPALVP